MSGQAGGDQLGEGQFRGDSFFCDSLGRKATAEECDTADAGKESPMKGDKGGDKGQFNKGQFNKGQGYEKSKFGLPSTTPSRGSDEGPKPGFHFGDDAGQNTGSKKSAPSFNFAPVDYTDVADDSAAAVEAFTKSVTGPVIDALDAGKVKTKTAVKGLGKKLVSAITSSATQVCGSFQDAGDQSDCSKAFKRFLKAASKVKTADDLSGYLTDLQDSLNELAGTGDAAAAEEEGF